MIDRLLSSAKNGSKTVSPNGRYCLFQAIGSLPKYGSKVVNLLDRLLVQYLYCASPAVYYHVGVYYHAAAFEDAVRNFRWRV